MNQHLEFTFKRTAPSPVPVSGKKPVPKPRFGLGDVVAAVAQPVAKLIDSVAGTKLAGCQPCAKRQVKLNTVMPDISKPLG